MKTFMKVKFCVVAFSTGLAVLGQNPNAAAGRLLPAVSLPPDVALFRTVLTGTHDNPGHARRVLKGTVSYSGGGAAVPFTFTRELDQNVRLDLGSGAGANTLIVTSIAQTPRAAQTPAGSNDAADHSVLETLASDAPEALLYLFGTSSGTISMGGHYQPPGTTASYAGPFSDIVAAHENSPYQPGAPERLKRYSFDSATHLLTSVLYVSSAGPVEIDYAGWTTAANGTACPGTITRQEGGSVVFTVTVASCGAGASRNDGLFSVGQ